MSRDAEPLLGPARPQIVVSPSAPRRSASASASTFSAFSSSESTPPPPPSSSSSSSASPSSSSSTTSQPTRAGSPSLQPFHLHRSRSNSAISSHGKIVAVKGPTSGLVLPRVPRVQSSAQSIRNAGSLDQWCGRQSRRTRVIIGISSVLVASIFLSLFLGITAWLLSQQYDDSRAHVQISGGGSDSMYDATNCLAIKYDSVEPACGHVAVRPGLDSLTGWEMMVNNSLTFALTQMIPANETSIYSNRIYLPFEANMLGLGVNLPSSPLFPYVNISREALVGIYDGSIKSWDDYRIRQTNDPAYPWPKNLAITPLHRTDAGSGASYIFQTLLCYLSINGGSFSPQWPNCPTYEKGWNDWPVDNPAVWPAIDNSTDMLAAVEAIEGAIGYLSSPLLVSNLPRAVQQASVQNQAGSFVLPSTIALSAAIELAPLSPFAHSPSFSIDLLDLADCPDCWPISSFGYIAFKKLGKNKQDVCFGNALRLFYRQCHRSIAQCDLDYNDDTDVCRCSDSTPLYGCLCAWQALCPYNTAHQLLQTLRSLQPAIDEPWPFVHPTDFGVVSFVLLLLLLSFLVVVFFIVRARRWALIRRDREQEKLRISRVSGLMSEGGSINPSSSETRQAQLLHEVEITDTGDCVQLLSVIGAGAWSRVYLAEWVGSPVAVKKFYQIPDHQQMQEDFFEETTIMSKLRHPNVVQLLAACSSPEFMLIMEYCRLGSLHGILQSFRERPSDVLFFTDVRRHLMAMDICRGLMYLHTRKPPIIHRDLKPHNILVTETLVCKLADFGMARSNLAGAVNNSHYAPRGTLAYLAREVITQQAWSLKSDIYSLTLTLWELFSTQEIFMGLSTNAIVKGVLGKELRPDLSVVEPELRHFFAQCWSEVPDSRPPIEIVFDFFVRLLPSKSGDLASHQKMMTRSASRILSLDRISGVFTKE